MAISYNKTDNLKSDVFCKILYDEENFYIQAKADRDSSENVKIDLYGRDTLSVTQNFLRKHAISPLKRFEILFRGNPFLEMKEKADLNNVTRSDVMNLIEKCKNNEEFDELPVDFYEKTDFLLNFFYNTAVKPIERKKIALVPLVNFLVNNFCINNFPSEVKKLEKTLKILSNSFKEIVVVFCLVVEDKNFPKFEYNTHDISKWLLGLQRQKGKPFIQTFLKAVLKKGKSVFKWKNVYDVVQFPIDCISLICDFENDSDILKLIKLLFLETNQAIDFIHNNFESIESFFECLKNFIQNFPEYLYATPFKKFFLEKFVRLLQTIVEQYKSIDFLNLCLKNIFFINLKFDLHREPFIISQFYKFVTEQMKNLYNGNSIKEICSFIIFLVIFAESIPSVLEQILNKNALLDLKYSSEFEKQFEEAKNNLIQYISGLTIINVISTFLSSRNFLCSKSLTCFSEHDVTNWLNELEEKITNPLHLKLVVRFLIRIALLQFSSTNFECFCCLLKYFYLNVLEGDDIEKYPDIKYILEQNQNTSMIGMYLLKTSQFTSNQLQCIVDFIHTFCFDLNQDFENKKIAKLLNFALGIAVSNVENYIEKNKQILLRLLYLPNSFFNNLDIDIYTKIVNLNGLETKENEKILKPTCKNMQKFYENFPKDIYDKLNVKFEGKELLYAQIQQLYLLLQNSEEINPVDFSFALKSIVTTAFKFYESLDCDAYYQFINFILKNHYEYLNWDISKFITFAPEMLMCYAILSCSEAKEDYLEKMKQLIEESKKCKPEANFDSFDKFVKGGLDIKELEESFLYQTLQIYY